MAERPTSLTIIGWFLIITGGISLLSTVMMQNNPVFLDTLSASSLPVGVHLAVALVGGLIGMVSGYGILKGFDWSRLLYVGWSLFGMVFGLVSLPITSFFIIGLVFFAVIVFFLFRAPANAWFGKSYFGRPA